MADKVHEADIAFPDEEGDDDEEEVTGREFGVGIESSCDESGQVRDEQAQGWDAEEFYEAVVQSELLVHSRFRPGLTPGEVL